jgi:penicillin-binding protein 2
MRLWPRRMRRGGLWAGPGPSGSTGQTVSSRRAAPGASGRSGAPAMDQNVAFRLAILGGIALSLLALLVMRLWFLQVIGTEAYASQAEVNRLRTVKAEGPRGQIVDRNGVVLADSRLVQNLVARPLELTGARRDRVIERLSEKLDIPAGELRGKLAEGDALPYRQVVLAEDVSQQVQLYVSERRRQFPGVTLEPAFLREYPEGELAAHVLGYTGAITEETTPLYERRGYLPDERVGVAGIESQYEGWLRGVPGERTFEVDSAGVPVDRGLLRDVPPKPGNTVQLTIDAELQRTLEQALRERVKLGTATGAAGVAIDPRNGEVLALASYPTFEPAAFVEGRDRKIASYFEEGANTPTLNRAITGEYPPGSTFKAISATAAVEEQILDPEALIFAGPDYEAFGTVFPNFQERYDGYINLRQALEISSDTYFYPLGSEFWKTPDRSPLKEWSEAFGLGAPTRIDLAGEARGLVPDQAWKRQAFAGPEHNDIDRSWRPGDDINFSVGQGYLLTTPLQMASAFSAIANRNALLLTPAIGKRVTDPGGRQLAALAEGRPTRRVDANPETLEQVREGLYRVANESLGTASTIFKGFPLGKKVAGKTGTAEDPPRQDHAWFIAYAPHEDPTIVVAIAVEQGGSGARSAAPGVCLVLSSYLGESRDICGDPPSLEQN